jgi:hypothetical protein
LSIRQFQSDLSALVSTACDSNSANTLSISANTQSTGLESKVLIAKDLGEREDSNSANMSQSGCKLLIRKDLGDRDESKGDELNCLI